MIWNDDIIQRARDVTGEDIAASMIERAYAAKCRAKGCGRLATQADGRCLKCSEETQALREHYRGKMAIENDDTKDERGTYRLMWAILAVIAAGLTWALYEAVKP